MKVMVKGGYQTEFGELWNRSLEDLVVEAGEKVIEESEIKRGEIDLVVVGNKLSGKLNGQDHLGPLVIEALGLECPAFRVEAACASGGVAVYQAVQAIKAGKAKTVLVMGVEKMTDKKNGEVAGALMGAASEAERRAGLTFPGLYALMARKYMEKFGRSRRDLARIAVRNHRNGSLNSKAQFRNLINEEMVLKAAMVAEPLGLLDCSPISDGAAGIILTRDKGEVEIAASEIGMDSLGLAERESLVELKATKIAVERAYKEARVGADQIEIAEVHDCFTIAQALALEDLGLAKKGKGTEEVKILVNTSGGLKACGHPVGATGVKQVVEIYKQLKGEAGERQVKGLKTGLTHNVGGTGGTVVVNILRKNYAL